MSKFFSTIRSSGCHEPVASSAIAGNPAGPSGSIAGVTRQPHPPDAVDRAIEAAEHLLLSRQSERLMVAFENIREGLGMYDGNERVVMMNHRYAEMYQIPSELQRPGTEFSTLLTYWREIGLLAGEQSRDIRTTIDASRSGGRFRLDLLDGRTYEVNEQFLPGGGWVSTHEDITDRVAAEKRILFLAEHDPLTGLFNRAAFRDYMQRLLPLADEIGPVRQPPPFALMIVDLNQFKPINDLYGHATGDMVLSEAAARMRAVCEGLTMIARLGGDEFVAIVEDAERADVMGLARRLRDAISRPVETEHREIELSASIGIAHYPDHAMSGRTLLKCADRALHVAKCTPARSIVSYSPDLDAAETERQELIRRLPKALADGEIELHFQPIVDALTGRCHTAEALLRWTHPERGRIAPEVVISIAEESRQINRLGNWILERALQTASRWPCSVAVAVNLSASQFKYQGFGAAVASMLKASGVAPERLELELTETVLCSDEAIATIHELRAMGVRISLDDFGTGYASMSYLLRIPFDRVKIDRSFVEQVDRRRDRRIIVEAVAGLATKLGLEIVAEGVETAAERAGVEAAGCQYLQGYLFAKPLPEKEFMEFLSAQARGPGLI